MTMQDGRPSTLERAFQLARIGTVRTVDEIRATLRREQHEAIDEHLSGATVKKQLLEAIARRKQA